MLNSLIEYKINLVLKESIQILKHDIVNIGSKMANRRIKKMKVVLHAELLKLSAGG